MSWLRRLSLGSRITALSVGAGVLLSLIAATAALTATATRSDTSRLTERVSPALVDAERLTAAALAQQSGAIQYAASGQTTFLDQYRRAVVEEEELYGSLQRRLSDEPGLLDRLRAVHADLVAWRSDIAQPLVEGVAATGPDPRLAIQPEAARNRFDAIVASISAFQNEVQAVRDRLRDHVRELGSILVALLFSAAVVVLAAGALLSLLLSRIVTRPVVELAGEVRRVARGDYDYEINVSGPAEVERLARDVNAMRRQIAADLTAVRLARQQIEDANQQLESQAEELTRSNRDLEQFAYVASHDLQEPLRKVASFCQLLQRRYAGQLDERADQYIYFAVDGAQRMQRLINDLLAFSRIGRVTTGFVEVDLNRVVDDIIGQREPVGGRITRDDLPTVRGEEPLLAALLSNLVGNSLKFRRPSTPARVHVSATRVGDEWELSVRDNGIGISAEFADKVFVIFQRLHSKEAYPGTGIGLAIAKKIVEYHGGRIWVDTEHEEGTVIRFTLPVMAPDEPDAPEIPVSPAVPRALDAVATPPAGTAESPGVEPAAAEAGVAESESRPDRFRTAESRVEEPAS